MPACHVGILHDARGPNNTLTLAEVSSLAALAEAAEIIRRGQADVVLAGGASSRIHPGVFLRNVGRQLSRRFADPAAACRPFDADRDGMVFGEGAAALVLEAREHAQHRGAEGRVAARIHGCAAAFEPPRPGMPLRGDAIRRAIRGALAAADWEPGHVGHVNAHGLSTTLDDRLEAQAIRDTLGSVPVTAPKSYFGNLGAATGAVELAAGVLALRHRLVPPTLNYQRPDPECPVAVVRGQAVPLERPTVLALNHAASGQAIAVALDAG
jgi:3-oxoacyl-[acyl-carrier-protein] synthase II